MNPDDPMAVFGAFGNFARYLVTLQRLQDAALDFDLVWLLPDDVLPGVTRAYGLPVIRGAVDRPMLAHDLAVDPG